MSTLITNRLMRVRKLLLCHINKMKMTYDKFYYISVFCCFVFMTYAPHVQSSKYAHASHGKKNKIYNSQTH